MRTTLDNTTLVEDANHIGMADCAEPMGDDNAGTIAEEVIESLLDEAFALGVEGGSRLIEDENVGIAENCASYADALALTAREIGAAVAYDGIVAILLLSDEIVGVGNLGSSFYFLLRSVLDTEGDIISDGIVEEDGVLADDAHAPAQIVEAIVADVDAIDEDGAGLDIPEAREEVDES